MTRISATEAARNFSAVLNRVRYRGESFLIVRAGESVARLTGAEEPGARLGDLLELLDGRRRDAALADDLERIQAAQPRIENDPWVS
jgi:prevent-host-death family protein